jgi:hypothetical protein
MPVISTMREVEEDPHQRQATGQNKRISILEDIRELNILTLKLQHTRFCF